MKIKITTSQLKQYYDIYRINMYCRQDLFGRSWLEIPAKYYNAGVFGWNYDAFILGSGGNEICLIDGDRCPKAVKIPDEVLKDRRINTAAGMYRKIRAWIESQKEGRNEKQRSEL